MYFNYEQQPGQINKHKYCTKKEQALVTIVTPYYNAGKYFEQTFNSVVNQTFPWFEWIIIDDGSTDKRDIDCVCRFAKKDPRITLYRQENHGVAYTRNVGFEKATTDIVIPLDADDVIAPQYVEYLYFGMLYNPEAAWCYTNSVGFQTQEYLWNYPWDAEKLKTYNFMTCSAAIRKKDFFEIGGYKVEKCSYHEDWRFWLEMLSFGKKPAHLGGYLFWYRRLDKGMLSNVEKDPEQAKFSEDIIKAAAEKADGTVRAVEYPLKKSGITYRKTKAFPWDPNRVVSPNNKKCEILMLIPWMVMGGADKFNLEFIKRLDPEKYHTGIISTIPSDNCWQQKFELYTDDIFNLPDFLDEAYYFDFVSYYLQSRKVDVVLITNSYIGYYMIPLIRKYFPEICIIDYVHMEEWYWKSGGYARLSGRFGELLDRTFVCNSATRECMINDFGRKPETVKKLYVGVDEKIFDENAVDGGYLYDLLKLPQSKKLVLFPCRIDPQKRPFMMLEIAKYVCNKVDDIVFVVVGDGYQLEELKQKITEKQLDGKVICVGRLEDMQKCYKDAYLTLICSLKEGLSLTAYESCSMGVPVISSDVGGQHDLIDATVGRIIPAFHSENDHFDSRAFDEEEIEMYAKAVLELCSDKKLYESCRQTCKERIRKEFSVDKMIYEFQNSIDDLLKNADLKQKHIGQMNDLIKLGDLAEELLTVKNMEDYWEAEANMNREAATYFKDQSQREKAAIQELENKLNLIYSMRTWKMTEKYRKFADNTRMGRGIRKICKKLYHLFR